MAEAPPSYYDATAGVAAGDVQATTTINLNINNKAYAVDLSSPQYADITPTTRLSEFIRTHTPYTGLKVFCHEGGCGACTVSVTRTDANGPSTVSAHACLRPLLSCNGQSIMTTEGVGGERLGYSDIQTRLANTGGTQCGFCSPGFVMNMYSLLQKGGPTPNALQIEQYFDGNLCRCTGYRPILDAMKSFAKPSEDDPKTSAERHMFADIHHMTPIQAKTTPETTLRQPMPTPTTRGVLQVNKENVIWQDCNTVADLNFWLQHYTSSPGTNIFMNVAGTSQGVFPSNPDVILNIAHIPELNELTYDSNGIVVGAAVTIADVITYMTQVAPSPAWYANHFPRAVAHLERVASNQIRNIASLVGNLIVTKNNSGQSGERYFCSDVFTVMLGLGAFLTVVDSASGNPNNIALANFVDYDMTGKYVLNITVPWASSPTETFQSYKIAKRQVNSHALVTAAFRVDVNASSVIVGSPTVVVGGVFSAISHLPTVEAALLGVNVTNNAVFQNTLVPTLQNAMSDIDPFSGNVEFRKTTIVHYFYKFFLTLQPSLPARLQSATQNWMTRPVSSGSQAYQPDPTEYPVSEPIPKLSGVKQCAGEAIYTEDIDAPCDTVFISLVHSTAANCTLQSIDYSAAAALPGFLYFFQAKDIDPDKNVWENGDLFCTGPVLFYGQCLGCVVADSMEHARACADAVKATYSNQGPVLVSIPDAIAANSFHTNPPIASSPLVIGDADKAIAASPVKISGTFDMGGQYHFHMENHSTLCIPMQENMRVYSATQMPINVQQAIVTSTGLQGSQIDVINTRCGGGFGGKLDNSILPAAIAGYVCYKLLLPCMIQVNLSKTTTMLGSRVPYHVEYQVGAETSGKINGISANVYANAGIFAFGAAGDPTVMLWNMDNCYNIPNWNLTAKMCKTNIPAMCAMRGPGWIPGVYMSEQVISAVAANLGIDTNTVRDQNWYKKGDTTPFGMQLAYYNMPTIWSQLQASAQWQQRQANVQAFNQANRWVKKGLAMQPVRFGVGYSGANFGSLVSIYPDGSVSVCTGGTEIGQGLNTKVAQTVAYELGCTMDRIKIQDSTTMIICGASNITGGSITSELCALSVINACTTLNANLAPVRKANPGVTWAQLIAAASGMGVNLSARGWSNPNIPNPNCPFTYNSYSAAVSEVTMDVLTGQSEVSRVDIVFDCGQSLNPLIDVGQVEGGFVMGQGYVLQEDVQWDTKTGEPLTGTTWEYKVPSAFDVPIELNVSLLNGAPNQLGVLGSKACGEPPMALAGTLLRATEQCISAALADSGAANPRYVVPSLPMTVVAAQQAAVPPISELVFA